MRTLALVFFSFNLYAGFLIPSLENKRTTDFPVIPKSSFFNSIDLFANSFPELPLAFDEKLSVYKDWNFPHIDSAYARRWDEAQILLYAGLAHRTEINIDALALIFCHELGHLYAGEPLKEMGNHISAEGQADYFATKYCLRRSLRNLNPHDIEERSLAAIKQVGKFLANNWGHTHPSIHTPDKSQVKETYKSYPSPQCRFDTYLAGLQGRERPKCWYASN